MESYYNGGANEQKGVGTDHFTVDDLLDFPNDDDALMPDNNSFIVCTAAATTDDSATFVSNDSCNSSSSGGVAYHGFAHDSHFSNELLVPYDDMAELEWLSNFVEDSFSTKQNLQITNLHIQPGYSKPTTPESSSSVTHPNSMNQNSCNPIFHPDTPLPGKARSKRSRVAPCDWSKHLVAPTTKIPSRRQDNPNLEGTARKCLHCAAEKTPQWRTGPMGPKTLCNACGVRYKSGRLVPEYRPAASPTFVATRHSNSHRKVMEIRRQKEFHHRAAHQQQFINQTSVFGDDYLIHQHNGPNFRHMI